MSIEQEVGVSTDGDMPIEISMVTEVLSEPVDLPELKINNRCVGVSVHCRVTVSVTTVTIVTVCTTCLIRL